MNPSVALAAYAEPFLDGRRVVIFGDAESALAEQLVERGARVVHVFDEDPKRAGAAAARNRSRNIAYAPLSDADVAVRDGAFDAALVPDLSAHRDRARLVKRVLRALSTRGLALFASPNPEVGASSPRGREPLGYYDLYDVVSAEFEEVRMLGQTPFFGYAVVDFAASDGEPDVSFDSGFVPGGAEEPGWYVAAASHRAIDLEAFMVIQLPATSPSTSAPPPRARGAEVAVAPEALAEPAPRDEGDTLASPLEMGDETQRHLTIAHARIAELESELAEARDAVDALQREKSALEAARRSATSERDEAQSDLREALEDRDRARAEAERRATERDEARASLEQAAAERSRVSSELRTVAAERDAATADAEQLRVQLEAKAGPDVGDLAREVEEKTARVSELEGELERIAAQRTALTTTARDLERQVRRLTEDAERNDLADDYAALERALVERAEEITRLQSALRDTETTGRDLLVQVRTLSEQLGAAVAVSAPEGRALLEADLQAARWTIDELEGLLESRTDAERAALERQLAETRAELRRRETLLAGLRRGENIEMPR